MPRRLRIAARALASALAMLALAGCFQQGGSRSDAPYSADPQRARIVFTALQMVGVPYRYGGTTPAGFDCSGLVQYAYRSAGISVPRTSREQLRASSPVTVKEATAGDLLFFRSTDYSHVGIYLGDGRFVHAPSTGRSVAIARLDEPYYKTRLVRAGRMAGVGSMASAPCRQDTGVNC